MTIYDVLMSDYERVDALLEKLVSVRSEKRAKELVEEIKIELIPHVRAEEALLYNTMRFVQESGDGDHSAMVLMLAELSDLELGEENWSVVAQRLRAALQKHMRTEETVTFPAAHAVLSIAEEEAMAVAFEEMKFEFRQGWDLQASVDLISTMLPRRLAVPLRKLSMTAH